MHYTISGTIAQWARLEFALGEAAWLSKGGLMAYSEGVQWRPRLPGGWAARLVAPYPARGSA